GLQRGGLKSAVQAVARLFVGRALFETPHHIQPPSAWVVRRAQSAILASQQRLASDRNSDGRVITYLQRPDERGGRHTDYSKRLLVEFDLMADDCGTRAEPLLPKLMAEHNHRRCARPFIFVSDRAS